MNWGSVESFFAMGGHGGAVWGAYGVMLAALVIELRLLRRRHQRARALTMTSSKGAS